jgi:hypothetical protein
MATPAPPPAPYQPVYPPAPSAPSGGTTVRIPAWLDFGVIIAVIGGILILVGFLYGNAFVQAEAATPPSASTIQNDYQAFFIWTGVGAFVAILGWAIHVMLPILLKSRKVAAAPAPAYMAPAAAPAAMPPSTPGAVPAAAQPAPLSPPVTPGAPNCSNCGKPTTYVAQYGRYYCYACARYV